MSDTNKGFLYGYEWDNAFDNCLTEDKFYTFGSYIDLCGMSIEDAMKGSSSGSTTGTTKTNNYLYVTLEEVTE